MKRTIVLITLLIMAVLFAGSCTDATVVSTNLSKAADQFEIYRRVVFYNGITGEYMLEIRGYCSLQDGPTGTNELQVVVKTAPGVYLKHFLGLSDNVTYFAEQIEPQHVSDARYRVIFKPSVIVPNIDLE